ncbi:hypothetical protein GON26_06225 [Flavobacterium sp. GA093]|uniref:Uncharacterized protein n=1 Tax=Flavobacterium hydrocarbonoxydans TaxID=2683249 RepID=A0A6I4NIG5_9FLAO|nr:hypothetical protein [Flavobacterium hydrocarbonoxydans]MWB93951.1 hypothetical protein [Flavobacterium hydrocarbonoxydans]
MNYNLNKKKKEYIHYTIIATFIGIACIFLQDNIDVKKFNVSTKILAKEPFFTKSGGPKNKKYWVELSFKNVDTTFKINESDYKYLSIEDFKVEVKTNDTLTISSINNVIYHLRKNDKDYLNFKRARKYENGKASLVAYMYAILVLFTLSIFLLNKKPRIRVFDKIYSINIDFLFLSIIFINIILIGALFGDEYFK